MGRPQKIGREGQHSQTDNITNGLWSSGQWSSLSVSWHCLCSFYLVTTIITHTLVPVKQRLTLLMPRLLSFEAQKFKNLWKLSQPSHVGIHRKALAEYYQMSTHVPGFQSFIAFCHHFMLTKLTTSSGPFNFKALIITYFSRNASFIWQGLLCNEYALGWVCLKEQLSFSQHFPRYSQCYLVRYIRQFVPTWVGMLKGNSLVFSQHFPRYSQL